MKNHVQHIFDPEPNLKREFTPHETTCEANPAGENSLFIFSVCVKSVQFYHSKLAYVVLNMAVKEFFKIDL